MLLGWLTEVLILNPALQLEGIMLLLQTFKGPEVPTDHHLPTELQELQRIQRD